MIDLHFFPTPNGHKISILLEELDLDWRLVPVDITKGEQFRPEFLAISPNNRIPAIVDHAPADGGPPLGIFESGAILTYLAEKTARFLPADLRGRVAVNEWLYWQVAGLAPNMGQWNHFARYGPQRIPYAVERFAKEIDRLAGVMDRRLERNAFLAGEYSIADMATYPWLTYAIAAGFDFSAFVHVTRWLAACAARPAVARGSVTGLGMLPTDSSGPDAASSRILYGQSDASVRGAAQSARDDASA